MDQRPSEPNHQLTKSDEKLETRVVAVAKNMTSLVLKNIGKGMDRNLLLKQHRNLVDALEELWNEVEKGDVVVDCLPLLRTARNVSCPEISRKLHAPDLDHAKIIRDLNLLVNTFTYVIRPKNSCSDF
ncbi:MAG: hypothetical protein EAX87_11540 [Candidatus Thorarchaeota archaeon]|nr:hypothetical protein [Candidatus Thorarchaeota archaeon]